MGNRITFCAACSPASNSLANQLNQIEEERREAYIKKFKRKESARKRMDINERAIGMAVSDIKKVLFTTEHDKDNSFDSNDKRWFEQEEKNNTQKKFIYTSTKRPQKIQVTNTQSQIPKKVIRPEIFVKKTGESLPHSINKASGNINTLSLQTPSHATMNKKTNLLSARHSQIAQTPNTRALRQQQKKKKDKESVFVFSNPKYANQSDIDKESDTSMQRLEYDNSSMISGDQQSETSFRKVDNQSSYSRSQLSETSFVRVENQSQSNFSRGRRSMKRSFAIDTSSQSQRMVTDGESTVMMEGEEEGWADDDSNLTEMIAMREDYDLVIDNQDEFLQEINKARSKSLDKVKPIDFSPEGKRIRATNESIVSMIDQINVKQGQMTSKAGMTNQRGRNNSIQKMFKFPNGTTPQGKKSVKFNQSDMEESEFQRVEDSYYNEDGMDQSSFRRVDNAMDQESFLDEF